MDRKLIDTFGWGFALWLMGYVLGIALFFVLPPSMLGWVIMPIGAAITIFVCLKRIDGKSVRDYVPMALVWSVMAVALDRVFIVLLLSAADYYKPDVYLYYALTFIIPLAAGYWKERANPQGSPTGKKGP